MRIEVAWEARPVGLLGNLTGLRANRTGRVGVPVGREAFRVRRALYCLLLDEIAAAALLAGFCAYDVASYAAFFDLLLPTLRSRLKARWSSLKYARRDMEELATTTIVEWRDSGLLRDGDTFSEVVERLVKAAAQSIQRRQNMDEKIADATAALPRESPSSPEKALMTNRMRQRVWDLQATLDPKHQRVLEAYAQSETEDRTMAEILGVSPEAARKMAERARRAFAELILQKGLKASDFLETSE